MSFSVFRKEKLEKVIVLCKGSEDFVTVAAISSTN